MKKIIIAMCLLSTFIFADELPSVSKDNVLKAMESLNKNPKMKQYLGNEQVMKKVREKLDKMSDKDFKDLQLKAKEKLKDKEYRNEVTGVLNKSMPQIPKK